jgi:hypothetical protein
VTTETKSKHTSLNRATQKKTSNYSEKPVF